MIGYKVLKVRDGKLYSLYAKPPYELLYEPGEVTIPTIGVLFCCDCQESAKDVARIVTYPHWQIWKVEMKDSQPCLGEIAEDTDAESIQNWWDGEIGYRHFRGTDAPPGTLWCTSIKLIEEIK